jgi:hypothetical protein
MENSCSSRTRDNGVSATQGLMSVHVQEGVTNGDHPEKYVAFEAALGSDLEGSRRYPMFWRGCVDCFAPLSCSAPRSGVEI